jgi:hypothetical protein
MADNGPNRLDDVFDGIYWPMGCQVAPHYQDGVLWERLFDVWFAHSARFRLPGQPQPTPVATWHRRVGHAGPERLAQHVQHGMATGASASAADMQELHHQDCEACTLSKLYSALFRTSESASSALLQLFAHGSGRSICTALPEVGRWLLLALDDYSKYSWVRVMRHKSDTNAQLQHLVRRCERPLTPLVVQRACSDQGGEFMACASREFSVK